MDGRTKGCLGAVAVTLIGGTLLCGCSGVAAMVWGPGWALSTIVQDEANDFDVPLAKGTTSDQIATRVATELTADRTTRISGPELNTLCKEGIDDGDVRVSFTFSGDHALMQFTGDMGEDGESAWINGSMGGTFVMEKGWFTEANIDELTVGSWELGSYIDGEPMVPDLNRSLADQRSEEPDLATALDAIERMTVENDELVFTTNEGWEAAVEAFAD